MQQQDPGQEFQERMSDWSRKSYSSANEQRLRSIAILAEDGRILPDPFGRQRCQRDGRTRRRIGELMLLSVRQEHQITCLEGDSLGVDAKKAAPRNDHVKTGAILNRESQTPRRSKLTACIEAA